jgi:hypothetical protein
MGRPKGSCHPPEVKEKIRQAMLGHPVSIVTRIKLSHALWKDGGRGKRQRKIARRRELRRLQKFAQAGGELNYLIAQQEKDDRTTQIKHNFGLTRKEDEVYGFGEES